MDDELLYKMNQKLDGLGQDVAGLRATVGSIDERLERIERPLISKAIGRNSNGRISLMWDILKILLVALLGGIAGGGLASW